MLTLTLHQGAPLKHLNKLVTALALTGISGFAAAQEVTLKFQHIWPAAGATPAETLVPWCNKIAAESNNRMKCQIFASMSGGGTPPQLVDRVKDGVDDLVITLPGYTPGRFPSLEVFELPFMTNQAEAASKAVWDYTQKYALKDFGATKVLAAWVHDEGYVHTAGKQIKTMADLKGVKIRAPHRSANRLLTALGATPVAMPPTSVQDAISKGTVDGALFPWEGAYDFRVGDVARFTTETPQSRPAMYTAVFTFLMNQAKYDSLPADLKAIIDRNSGAALSAQYGKRWDNSLAPSKKALLAKGNQVYVLPDAEVDAWRKTAESVSKDWYSDMEKRGLPAKAMMDDAVSLLAKYK
jgi:TRAP-type transport system periplasmic protein